MTDPHQRKKSLGDFLKGIKDEPRPASFKDTLKELAESSSLHGIPKIVSSHQIAVKILWCLLFLGTASVLAYQLFGLFQTYYSYPIQTSVSLEFSAIQFPAISICNMNPVRKSKLNQSEALASLLNELPDESKRRKRREARRIRRETGQVPPEVNEYPDDINTDDIQVDDTVSAVEIEQEQTKQTTTQGPSNDENENLQEFHDLLLKSFEEYEGLDTPDAGGKYGIRPSRVRDGDIENTKQRYKRGTGSSSSDGGTGSSSSESSSSSSYYSSSSYSYSSSSYYDYWWYSYGYGTGGYNTGYYDYWDTDNFDRYTSKKDIWEQRVEDVKTVFRNTTLRVRQDIGHQKDDLFLSATFAGQTQTDSRLKNFSSNDYGNCYTFSAPKYVAFRSGPAYGFKITLNLEVDEYIANFTTGYGARVVFHEPFAQPLPSSDGITLSPGTETNIGLKTVKISRLGPPHGNCDSGKEFATQHKLKYSLTACYEFCRMKATVDQCDCLPPDAPDAVTLNTTYVPVCNSSTESDNFRCVFELNTQFNEGTVSCNCREPCNEYVYSKTMSSTYWPTHDYLYILLDDVCSTKNKTEQWSSVCANIDDLDYYTLDRYRNNFVRVLIYFEDLNYEQIAEEPLYEGVRFLSDIGGAMGLFMGASVLSMVEVFQLFLEIILYCKNKNKNKTQIQDIRR